MEKNTIKSFVETKWWSTGLSDFHSDSLRTVNAERWRHLAYACRLASAASDTSKFKRRTNRYRFFLGRWSSLELLVLSVIISAWARSFCGRLFLRTKSFYQSFAIFTQRSRKIVSFNFYSFFFPKLQIEKNHHNQ